MKKNSTDRIAVTSRSFSQHPILRSELEERYTKIKFNDKSICLKGKELIEYLWGYNKVISGLEVVNLSVLNALPDLKVLSKYGVGLDMLDLKAMKDKGVQLGWEGGVNKRSVSELVVCYAISMLRHVPAAQRGVLAGDWRQLKGRLLTGKTVGIIGCGHVGKDLVPLLRAFDCRVLVNDVLEFPDFYSVHDVEPANLSSLLALSDVVTLHTPLDERTKNILSAERLSMMKKDAILINLARGNLVDEVALKKLLKSKILGAAAFDVFATEPPLDYELLELSNFLVSPHIGGSSEEAILAMGRAAISGLENYGDPLEIVYGGDEKVE
jgi:D-3-phosphoglycerate dehydrogenase